MTPWSCSPAQAAHPETSYKGEIPLIFFKLLCSCAPSVNPLASPPNQDTGAAIVGLPQTQFPI